MTSRPASRRGSVYLIVLSTAIIVTVIAVTGIIASGLQLKQASALDDVAQARFLAITALNLAAELVEEDPNWRSDHDSDVWVTPLEMAGGTMSWKFVDVDDGNLDNGDSHTVRLHVRGQCGQIVRTYGVDLEFDSPGEMIHNGDVEDGLAGWWVPDGEAVLQLRTDIVHSGSQAVLATSRATDAATPWATLDEPLEEGLNYDAEAWIMLPSGTTSLKLYLFYQVRNITDHTITKNKFEQSPWFDDIGGTWTLVYDRFKPTWAGHEEFVSASLFIETDTIFDVVVDDYSVTPALAPTPMPSMTPASWRQELD